MYGGINPAAHSETKVDTIGPGRSEKKHHSELGPPRRRGAEALAPARPIEPMLTYLWVEPPSHGSARIFGDVDRGRLWRPLNPTLNFSLPIDLEPNRWFGR